jgi:hypothetical protein
MKLIKSCTELVRKHRLLACVAIPHMVFYAAVIAHMLECPSGEFMASLSNCTHAVLHVPDSIIIASEAATALFFGLAYAIITSLISARPSDHHI